MGVPNTTTFTLQNVVDTVNPSTDDLTDCFSDAVASLFDSSYEGSKNQLLNFRNYGNLTSFSGSIASKNPCSLSTSITYYHNGSGTYPVAGDFVFTNASGSSILSPGGNYKMGSGTKMEIQGGTGSNAGSVVAITLC